MTQSLLLKLKEYKQSESKNGACFVVVLVHVITPWP